MAAVGLCAFGGGGFCAEEFAYDGDVGARARGLAVAGAGAGVAALFAFVGFVLHALYLAASSLFVCSRWLEEIAVGGGGDDLGCAVESVFA